MGSQLRADVAGDDERAQAREGGNELQGLVGLELVVAQVQLHQRPEPARSSGAVRHRDGEYTETGKQSQNGVRDSVFSVFKGT